MSEHERGPGRTDPAVEEQGYRLRIEEPDVKRKVDDIAAIEALLATRFSVVAETSSAIICRIATAYRAENGIKGDLSEEDNAAIVERLKVRMAVVASLAHELSDVCNGNDLVVVEGLGHDVDRYCREQGVALMALTADDVARLTGQVREDFEQIYSPEKLVATRDTVHALLAENMFVMDEGIEWDDTEVDNALIAYCKEVGKTPDQLDEKDAEAVASALLVAYMEE